jgi:uncharacterized RDD family membrane protein YckC
MYGAPKQDPQTPTEPPYSGKRWKNFLIGNAIALTLCGAIFALFLYGDFLSGASEGLMRSLFDVPVLVVLIASMPLIVGIAIGVAHMQKAMRKRRAERQAMLRAAARPEEPPSGA